MKKVGVVIGRFQVASLHAGHMHLLEWAKQQSDVLVVLIGTSKAQHSLRNPLPYAYRKEMLERAFPSAHVLEKPNHASDAEWSREVDELLEANFPNCSVMLYGSRDSFKSSYSGKFAVTTIPEVSLVSATDKRLAPQAYTCGESFRAGMIEQARLRHPTSYQTVDIAVMKYTANKPQQILLGRKPTDLPGLWRLPGGFVEPEDASLEGAASRELSEEVPGILTHEFTYLGSYRIDDYRYRHETDKILTALFMTYVMGGRVQAGDDLAEVAWFSLEDVRICVIPDHVQLVEKICEHVLRSQK